MWHFILSRGHLHRNLGGPGLSKVPGASPILAPGDNLTPVYPPCGRGRLAEPGKCLQGRFCQSLTMRTSDHDLPAILKAILPGYTLPHDGTHGLTHWARVLENGLRLCEATGADAEVVTLFAVFHDARRVNEYHDDGHGHRGADLAASLRGSLVHLDDHRFELLYEACRLHTDGCTAGDLAMQVCWDSDRLDLGRVGIQPLPSRLCTAAARGLIDWAHERAEREHVPAGILTEWGCNFW